MCCCERAIYLQSVSTSECAEHRRPIAAARRHCCCLHHRSYLAYISIYLYSQTHYTSSRFLFNADRACTIRCVHGPKHSLYAISRRRRRSKIVCSFLLAPLLLRFSFWIFFSTSASSLYNKNHRRAYYNSAEAAAAATAVRCRTYCIHNTETRQERKRRRKWTDKWTGSSAWTVPACVLEATLSIYVNRMEICKQSTLRWAKRQTSIFRRPISITWHTKNKIC